MRSPDRNDRCAAIATSNSRVPRDPMTRARASGPDSGPFFGYAIRASTNGEPSRRFAPAGVVRTVTRAAGALLLSARRSGVVRTTSPTKAV